MKKSRTHASASPDKRKEAHSECREGYQAIAYLCCLNQVWYQPLLDELANYFLNGRDEYPKTLIAAYNLVTNWSGKHQVTEIKEGDGVAFNQVGEEDKELYKHVNAET